MGEDHKSAWGVGGQKQLFFECEEVNWSARRSIKRNQKTCKKDHLVWGTKYATTKLPSEKILMEIQQSL